MGLFSKAAKSVGQAIQKTGKGLSKGAMGAVATGATGMFEYTTLKPLEYVAPKVLSYAKRGAGLLGTASQTLGVAQQAAADNQQLLSMIPGMGDLGGLLGGGMPADTGGGSGLMANQSPSVPTWVWIAGGLAAALGLFLILRKK